MFILKKEYHIEIRVDGILYGDTPPTFIMDKSKNVFNQMLMLVERVVALLEDAEFIDDVTHLRIYSDEDVLFESLDSFYTYMVKHKIEGFLEGDLSTYIVVNGFRYRGQVLEEMILLEDLEDNSYGIPS